LGEVSAGEVIDGKYRVERVLGRGGMGIVVAARHQRLDEMVALKLMLPHIAQDPAAVARFDREARASIRIRSEHVVRVHDVGNHEGTPYMVMEYLEGMDLGALVHARGRLDVRTAVDYVLQACEAIAEAHSLGIIHRDVKPQNFFVTSRRDGSPLVKVLDFGIAKAAGDERGVTKTGMLVGSPQYMAPEQLLTTSMRVDARTDIWAICCVLYELLSKKVPFPAQTLPDLLIRVQSAAPEPLSMHAPNLPPGVEMVIAKCLEKDPGRRFPDVAMFAAALAPFGTDEARSSSSRIARVLGSQPRVVHAGASDADASSRTLPLEPGPHYAPQPNVPLAAPTNEGLGV